MSDLSWREWCDRVAVACGGSLPKDRNIHTLIEMWSANLPPEEAATQLRPHDRNTDTTNDDCHCWSCEYRRGEMAKIQKRKEDQDGQT